MDELFEALTLIQTGKIQPFPVVLMGTAYWQPLLQFMRRMAAEAMIDEPDLNLVTVTDDPDEALHHIERHAVQRFGLRAKPRSAPGLRLPTLQPNPVSQRDTHV